MMQITEEQRKALVKRIEELQETQKSHWTGNYPGNDLDQQVWEIALAALTENWHERAEAAEAKLKDAQENSGFWGRAAAKETIRANKAEEKLAEHRARKTAIKKVSR